MYLDINSPDGNITIQITFQSFPLQSHHVPSTPGIILEAGAIFPCDKCGRHHSTTTTLRPRMTEFAEFAEFAGCKKSCSFKLQNFNRSGADVDHILVERSVFYVVQSLGQAIDAMLRSSKVVISSRRGQGDIRISCLGLRKKTEAMQFS